MTHFLVLIYLIFRIIAIIMLVSMKERYTCQFISKPWDSSTLTTSGMRVPCWLGSTAIIMKMGCQVLAAAKILDESQVLAAANILDKSSS